MRQLLTISLSFVMVVFISCAHKAPPLAKDRLSPKLIKVAALNNRQIQFTFSENIDTLNLKLEYFNIIHDSDTLKVTAIYPSLSASEIIIINEPKLMDSLYKTSGYVYDTAQNKGNFTKSFIGTSAKDTIAPWVVKYPRGKNQKEFYLLFSEAMDTTFLEFYILPKKNMKSVWDNLRVCRLVPVGPDDSLDFDTTYYLYINKGARDISGNLVDTFITSITPDTVYKPLILRGEAKIADTLVKGGLAILKKIDPIGITTVLQGRFSFEVRDSSTYNIEVISGKFSGSAEVKVDSTNLIILESKEKDIDSIIN